MYEIKDAIVQFIENKYLNNIDYDYRSIEIILDKLVIECENTHTYTIYLKDFENFFDGSLRVWGLKRISKNCDQNVNKEEEKIILMVLHEDNSDFYSNKEANKFNYEYLKKIMKPEVVKMVQWQINP